MRDDLTWQPLRDALQRISDQGRTARLWLRDDDAVEPTAALDRLLSLTRDHAVPLGLAVIPAFTGPALVERLQIEDHVSVTVHGWSHENHAPAERKKQELGPERPVSVVLDQLRAAFDQLRALYPQTFEPVLVPPWNRIDPALLPSLAALGYRAVSVYGKAKQAGAIRLINTHVDIMDWHGTGGCRPQAELVTLLAAELGDRLADSDEPIGILTHHLVHDAAAWDFLARLFEECRAPAIRWHALGDLLRQTSIVNPSWAAKAPGRLD